MRIRLKIINEESVNKWQRHGFFPTSSSSSFFPSLPEAIVPEWKKDAKMKQREEEKKKTYSVVILHQFGIEFRHTILTQVFSVVHTKNSYLGMHRYTMCACSLSLKCLVHREFQFEQVPNKMENSFRTFFPYFSSFFFFLSISFHMQLDSISRKRREKERERMKFGK